MVALPGVTVTAVNQANGLTREAVTDELGTYRFSAMPPGVYTVKAALAGFKEASRADLRLAINSQLVAPFTLEVGGLEETITVTEQAPLVDTTENVVRTLVDTQQIASLPLKTRDFLDLTLLAPGVVADQGSASGGQTDSISFGGMSENYKSVWLEGVDFNDEVTGGGSALSSATRIALAQEAIQEFQVMANSYTAEFGRSASGAINILTKSGGNQVHGSGFYFLRDDAFDQPNYFAVNVPPFKIEQYGATVGGPIVTNRLFYFASWEKRANERSVQVNIPTSIAAYVQSLGYDASPDVPVIADEHNLFGKGTFLASQNHTVNATYMYDHRDLTNQQTGGNSAGDHGYDDKRRAWFLVGNLTSVLRSNLVNELRLSASHQALDRVLPAGLDQQARDPLPDRAVRPCQQRAAGPFAGQLHRHQRHQPQLRGQGHPRSEVRLRGQHRPDDQHHQPVVQRPVRIPAGPAGDRRRPDVAAVPLHAGRRAARRAGGADPRRQHLLGLRQQPVAAGRQPHHQPRPALRLAAVARRPERAGHPRPTCRSSSSGCVRSPAICAARTSSRCPTT